jgi:hypothetical protein
MNSWARIEKMIDIAGELESYVDGLSLPEEVYLNIEGYIDKIIDVGNNGE